MLRTDHALHQRYAAIAAERNYNHNPDLLLLAAQSEDEEIKTFADDMLRLHRA
jgi:ABC-type Fe3+-citrate transport system substrate-binding protein